jgi:hypothetical protein
MLDVRTLAVLGKAACIAGIIPAIKWRRKLPACQQAAAYYLLSLPIGHVFAASVLCILVSVAAA